MRNDFLKSFIGSVTVEVAGQYPERLLNACLKNDVHVWNVRHAGNDKIQFDVALSDIAKIRVLFRHSGCKTTFTKRSGLPFFMKKVKIRAGFAIGMVAFFMLMLSSSSMVWGIHIKGASPHVEQELREVIDEIGIRRGAFQFKLPQPDEVQRIVTEHIDEATWIGVRKKGTTFEFEVVEQVRQEAPELLSPRHLVAAKKAVIHKIFVEDGKAVKKTNDFVEEGELLVSGFIGAEGKEQTVAAKASVIGEIWYTSSVTVPLENTFASLTGEQQSKRMLVLGDIELPFWNIKEPDYETYETFERETEWSLFGYRLPIQFRTIEQRETLEFTRTYTKEEAVAVAKEEARRELREKIPEDAEIMAEHVLQEAVENDKVSLMIHYQVLEEIAREKPIIQGD